MSETAILITVALAAAVGSALLYRRTPRDSVRPRDPLDNGWSKVLIFDASLLLASAMVFPLLAT